MSWLNKFWETNRVRMEKVKFGVPLKRVWCDNSIPTLLLELILKINKKGKYQQFIFRASSTQSRAKQLKLDLENGRATLENYSVLALACILKEFVRLIPGSIFNGDVEKHLFAILDLRNRNTQQEETKKILLSLNKETQEFLVLVIGTFSEVAKAHQFNGMSSLTLAKCVGPSFFSMCQSFDYNSTQEDIEKFEQAPRVIEMLINFFEECNLFGRENYEYYIHRTGRVGLLYTVFGSTRRA